MTFKQTLSPKNQKNYELTPKIDQFNTSESYFFHGATGVGKTAIVLAMAKRAIKEYKIAQEYEENHVRFVKILDLIKTARMAQSSNEEGNQAKNRLDIFKEIDLLIIDDFGVEKNTEFVDQEIYDLIDTRYENELMTYFTSNYSLQEISEKYDARIASRISEMCNFGANVIEIGGRDKRTKNL